MVEETNEVIKKTKIEGGKEEKIYLVREQALQLKDHARALEKDAKEDAAEAKKVFDRVLNAKEEQKQLKREIQFLKGPAGHGFIDKVQMGQLADAAFTKKQKVDKRNELLAHLKRRHGEIMMKDKVHQ